MPSVTKRKPIGKLRHYVQLQQRREVRDALGGVNQDESPWEDLGWIWCNIEPIRGREFWSAQQVKSDITHKVTMRYDETMTSSHRILHKNRELNFAAPIDNNEVIRQTTVMAVEATAGNN